MSTGARRGGRGVVIALAALAVAGATGCKREKQLAGVDRWNVKHTRLKDATGRCTPTDFPDGRSGMWCFGQQPIGIKGMAVDIDLYFAGTAPETPIAELQLKVRACNEDKILEWMRQNWGAPYQDNGKVFLWRNDNMRIAGFIPDEPASCLLRMYPPAEQAAFERAANK
ncbi:MAG: hypothetical protein H6708_17160 [Kofleriaceae bacterium]|nr:hypothetical protein [Myxococcales bacterium]MCB9562136.1 hypothetical protein [Kofleriaceae bacterium]